MCAAPTLNRAFQAVRMHNSVHCNKNAPTRKTDIHPTRKTDLRRNPDRALGTSFPSPPLSSLLDGMNNHNNNNKPSDVCPPDSTCCLDKTSP